MRNVHRKEQTCVPEVYLKGGQWRPRGRLVGRRRGAVSGLVAGLLLLGVSPIANTQSPWTLLFSANPAMLTPDGVSTSQLTATVLDEWGMPVSGVTVYFSATNGTLSEGAGTTGQNGQATTTLTAGGDPSFAITATASACGASNHLTLYDPAQAGGGDPPAPPPPPPAPQAAVQVEIVFPGGGTVAGMSLPVWGYVTLSDPSCTFSDLFLYANGECVAWLGYWELSFQPLEYDPTVSVAKWSVGMGVPLHGAAKQQTLVAQVTYTHMVQMPDNPPMEQAVQATASSDPVTFTVDNTPTVAGPEAYVTVPADPEHPGMGSVDGPAPSPLKGSVGLKAKVTPASMWIPFDEEFQMGGYVNVDSVDSVRFEAGGQILAQVAPGPEPELDPDDPTGLTVIYRTWWDTAAQWQAGQIGPDGTPVEAGSDTWGAPKWPDGPVTVTAKAFSAATPDPFVGESSADFELKNKGTVSGTVLDGRSDTPVEQAFVKAVRSYSVYIGPPEPQPPANPEDWAAWQAYWAAQQAWCTAYADQANWQSDEKVFASATTGADGQYSLELYPGGYSLKCQQDAKYVRSSATIGMPPAGELTHDFELQRRLTVTITPNILPEGYNGTVTIHVELLDSHGNPAAGTTTITVNVCGQQTEVTVTDGVGDATVTVGPLGCPPGRHRAPSGPGGQADPGGPFDPDPNNPDLPPIPGGAGGEMDNPTYGVGECNLEIVEPTTGQVIGGNVTVTLQVTMDQGLSVNIDSVQAQEITDLHPVEWIPVYPSQGGGDPGNPNGGGLTQVSDTVVDGHRVLTYECSWNTLPTHNFPHRLVATARFSPGGEMPGGGGTGGVTKTAETQPVVGNLVITDVETNAGNADYLKLDLDSDDPQLQSPDIRFTITDIGDPHRYAWRVHIRDTSVEEWSPEGYVALTGTAEAPGEVTAPWGGKGPGGDWAPAGTYTFDIHVEEIDEDQAPIDGTSLKAPYNLGIPQQAVVEGEQVPGHLMTKEIAEGTATVRLSYLLTDASGLTPETVEFHLLDGALALRSSATGPTALGQWHDGVVVGTLPEEELEESWRALFMGSDGHRAETRSHQPRRMLAVNQNPVPRPSANFVLSDFDQTGQEAKKCQLSTVQTVVSGPVGVVSPYGRWWKRNVDWTTGAYSVDTSKTPPRRRWTKVNMVCVDPHADTVYQALGYSHPYSPHVFSFAGHGWLYDMGGALFMKRDGRKEVLVFGTPTGLADRSPDADTQLSGSDYADTWQKRFTGTLAGGAGANIKCAVILACAAPGTLVMSSGEEHFSGELSRLGVQSSIVPQKAVPDSMVRAFSPWFWELACLGVGDVEKGLYSSTNSHGWQEIDVGKAFRHANLQVNPGSAGTTLRVTGGAGLYLHYPVTAVLGGKGANIVHDLPRTVTRGVYWDDLVP